MTDGRSRTALLAAGAVFLAALVLPALVSGYGIRILNLALISAIAVIGLNFAFGYAGLITLAQAGFVGCGAYRHHIPATVDSDGGPSTTYAASMRSHSPTQKAPEGEYRRMN